MRRTHSKPGKQQLREAQRGEKRPGSSVNHVSPSDEPVTVSKKVPFPDGH